MVTPLYTYTTHTKYNTYYEGSCTLTNINASLVLCVYKDTKEAMYEVYLDEDDYFEDYFLEVDSDEDDFIH